MVLGKLIKILIFPWLLLSLVISLISLSANPEPNFLADEFYVSLLDIDDYQEFKNSKDGKKDYDKKFAFSSPIILLYCAFCQPLQLRLAKFFNLINSIYHLKNRSPPTLHLY